MEKLIYAETTLMYRPIHPDELSQFSKLKKSYRKKKIIKNKIDYRKKLFSSNFRPFIMMANGIQTGVEKGSKDEEMFWSVKDYVYSPGYRYYFDTPEQAECLYETSYPNDLKSNWHKRKSQIRFNYNNDIDIDTDNDIDNKSTVSI